MRDPLERSALHNEREALEAEYQSLDALWSNMAETHRSITRMREHILHVCKANDVEVEA